MTTTGCGSLLRTTSHSVAMGLFREPQAHDWLGLVQFLLVNRYGFWSVGWFFSLLVGFWFVQAWESHGSPCLFELMVAHRGGDTAGGLSRPSTHQMIGAREYKEARTWLWWAKMTPHPSGDRVQEGWLLARVRWVEPLKWRRQYMWRNKVTNRMASNTIVDRYLSKEQ